MITVCSWLSVHFGQLQFVVLESMSQHQSNLLRMVSFWRFLFPVLCCPLDPFWQIFITFCSRVSAFRPTSACSSFVDVPASNWFAVGRVFLMIFVSSFVMSVGFSLTNSDNILQLNVRAFSCTSDNVVSLNVPASDCLTVESSVKIFGSSFVMYIGISLTSTDNVFADFALIWFQCLFNYVVHCACMKLIFCGSSFWWFLFPVSWCP